jgi:hypothetical protein
MLIGLEALRIDVIPLNLGPDAACLIAKRFPRRNPPASAPGGAMTVRR